jgi:DNA-3-methyladenine glycosylase I
MEQTRRCEWAGPEQIYIDYYDNEWGQPLHDDNKLFEMLILEGMQAGLAWITVLKKREAFRAAFDSFNPQKMALYDDTKVEELMANAGIIRHRGKINAAIGNAKAFLEIQREHGSFDRFIWAYVGGTPIVNAPHSMAELPACTPLSDKISKDPKKRGFKFVGSTIIYAFMQAVGMVDDHMVWCPWHTSRRNN